MNVRVEFFTDLSPDQLSRQRWVLWVSDNGKVYVDAWAPELRQSRRHKWRAQAVYSRLSNGIGERLNSPDIRVAEHPPITPELARQAAFAILAELKFAATGASLASTFIADEPSIPFAPPDFEVQR